MKTNDLYAEAVKAVTEYRMLDGQKGVLVGYSGGADSSVLLCLLKRLCDEQKLYLHAIHVNHGIRGAEADRDAEFCRHECERMGIDFTLVNGDVPGLAAKLGCGIEEAARQFRYGAFFEKLRSDEKLTCVATAHNCDDNAETVLYNLTRGSGLSGMCGIPPVRITDGVKVIRPLIFCTKDRITEYCRQNGVKYMFDSTNSDTVYTRNYIRHTVLPGMRRLNPALSETVLRMSETLRRDREFLERLSDDFLERHSCDGRLSVKLLMNEDYAVASRAVGKMILAVNGRAPEKVHIDAVLGAAASGKDGKSVSLPGGLRAVISGGVLGFCFSSQKEVGEFFSELKPGIVRLEAPDFGMYVNEVGKESTDLQKGNETLKNIYKLSTLIRVNSDKIKNRLFLRSRQNGDSYVFGGMTRRLKKLYNDKGFSLKKRAELPVICDDEGIIWVPGFPAADRVKVSDGAPSVELIYYFNGE